MMKMHVFTLIGLLVACSAIAQPPRTEPPKAVMVLEDQFERKQDIAQFKGDVLVILYGDREGMPANKGLGEKLYLQYHPTAKGQTGAKVAKAPVIPVLGVADGMPSPDVRVLPVVCLGKVPDVVKNIVRSRVKKESPEGLVLLDFESKMKDQFGLKEGVPNLVVIDAQGRVRMKSSGELDAASYAKLLQAIDFLRNEALAK